jgi:hypothetical protein
VIRKPSAVSARKTVSPPVTLSLASVSFGRISPKELPIRAILSFMVRLQDRRNFYTGRQTQNKNLATMIQGKYNVEHPLVLKR